MCEDYKWQSSSAQNQAHHLRNVQTPVDPGRLCRTSEERRRLPRSGARRSRQRLGKAGRAAVPAWGGRDRADRVFWVHGALPAASNAWLNLSQAAFFVSVSFVCLWAPRKTSTKINISQGKKLNIYGIKANFVNQKDRWFVHLVEEGKMMQVRCKILRCSPFFFSCFLTEDAVNGVQSRPHGAGWLCRTSPQCS